MAGSAGWQPAPAVDDEAPPRTPPGAEPDSGCEGGPLPKSAPGVPLPAEAALMVSGVMTASWDTSGEGVAEKGDAAAPSISVLTPLPSLAYVESE